MRKRETSAQLPREWIDSVWRMNADKIYKLCVIKCKSEDDAKDLFQTVALKFCQHAISLRNREGVLPWMICVLRNSYCDMVAERKNVYTVSNLKEKISLATFPNEKSIFYRGGQGDFENFESLFSVLNPLERLIVELSYIGGFTTMELSNILGLSTMSIRKRRHFALLKMRDTLTISK